MADTFKKLYNGTLGTSSATLYTVPSDTITVVTEIIICNRNSSGNPTYVTLTFDSTNVIYQKTVVGKDTIVIKTNTILEASDIIAGLAETATSIDVCISGVEMT